MICEDVSKDVEKFDRGWRTSCRRDYSCRNILFVNRKVGLAYCLEGRGSGGRSDEKILK